MAFAGGATIYSNDGTEMLYRTIEAFITSISVTSTGAMLYYGNDNYALTFTYSGSNFAGFATSPNATIPTYTVGSTYTDIDNTEEIILYVVEATLSGAWRFKRLYDRGAVEMPTILYTPNMDYKKYLILHSRSNYDADEPKDRYYILWFRDDADPVTTYTNSSYMQVQFVNSDTANPVFYCSSSYYTTAALAKEAMQKSTTSYSVPSLVRIYKFQTGTSSTSISLLGYYVNSNSSLLLAISGTKTRDTITGLNYSSVTLSHAFSSETVREIGTPASFFIFHWLSTEQEKLIKPVLTDLSTETQCIFSFPNDTRAYAYKIFVDGVEQSYPLKWTATLTDGIYTVTIADSVFTSEGEYEITAQAYILNGRYADSDMSDVLIFTKSKPKLAAPVIVLTAPAHGDGENAGGGIIE